jgi:hypothetical protein
MLEVARCKPVGYAYRFESWRRHTGPLSYPLASPVLSRPVSRSIGPSRTVWTGRGRAFRAVTRTG